MAKQARPTLDVPPPPRLSRGLRGLIVLGLILALPVFEESKVIAARWLMMFGHPTPAETPVLDALAGWNAEAWGSIRGVCKHLFRESAWGFAPMMVGATAWMLALAMLLRGMRR